MLYKPRRTGSCAITIFAMAMIFMVFASTTYARPRRILVLPVQNNAVGLEVPIGLLEILQSDSPKLPEISLLMPGKRTIALSEKCKGHSKIQCLSRLGKRWKADEVLIGLVTANSKSYVIDLALISVRKKEKTEGTSYSIPDKAEMVSEGLRGAAFKLLAPEQFFGSIRIDFSEPNAEIFLNGYSMGTTPLSSPVLKVPPGQHKIAIRKPGFNDFNRMIEVKFDQELIIRPVLKGAPVTTEALALTTLENSPNKQVTVPSPVSLETARAAVAPKPFPRWPGYTALAAGGVLIASGLVHEIQASSIKKDAHAMQDENGLVTYSNNESARKKNNEYRSKTIAGAIMLGVGAAAALGGGTYLYLAPTNSGAQLGAAGQF